MDEDQDKIPTREAFDAHRQMVVWLFVATVGCTLLLGVLLFVLFRSGRGISALPTVFLVGTLGGFVSALRRLYAFHRIFPSGFFFRWLKNASAYLVVYSLIPPVVGGVAAVALYVLFSSQMVTGDLFPTFACASGTGTCDTFPGFVANWQPAAAREYGKVLVWGFIAGFSERFVPDILNRLGADAVKA